MDASLSSSSFTSPTVRGLGLLGSSALQCWVKRRFGGGHRHRQDEGVSGCQWLAHSHEVETAQV